MPMINGVWVDDATGVPDQGMPPGMGDPTGAIVQPTTMQRPQLGPQAQLAPPQAPQAPQSFMNMQGPPIPLPETDRRIRAQIQQGFQQLDRPSMGPGDLARTIISAPLTVPMGIVEELRGLMGGSTIEGWANQARSRYNDPNFAESRAFGVRGAAEEPTFGDRFLGVVTGSAQRGAMAGKIIRQQIGEYNASRKAALRENKDVMQLQQGEQSLQLGDINLQRTARKNEIERKYAELQASLGVQTSQLGLANTRQQMQEREVQIAKLQVELGLSRAEAEALVQKTQLFNTPGVNGGFPARGLTGPAANVPGLLPDTVEAARKAEADQAQREADATALRRAQPVNPSLQTGPEAAAAADAKIVADRVEAERQRKAQEDEINATIRDVDQAFEARKHTEIKKPGFLDFGAKSIPDQIRDLDNEAARLKADVASGKYIGKRGEAILTARGLSTQSPSPMLNATPVPGATPTPSALVDRIGTMSPEARVAEQLQREGEAAVPTPRPTPMATSRPPGTTNFVDLNKAPPEATRQREAKNEAAANEEFLLNWVMHEGWNAPRTGPRFESMKAAFMAKKGL